MSAKKYWSGGRGIFTGVGEGQIVSQVFSVSKADGLVLMSLSLL